MGTQSVRSRRANTAKRVVYDTPVRPSLTECNRYAVRSRRANAEKRVVYDTCTTERNLRNEVVH